MQNDYSDAPAIPIVRRAWRAPQVILSELTDTQKFSNTLESPPTLFGGGGVLTNQGPS